MGVQKRSFLSAGWRVSLGAAYYLPSFAGAGERGCLYKVKHGCKGKSQSGARRAARILAGSAPFREWLVIRAFCRQALANGIAEIGSTV